MKILTGNEAFAAMAAGQKIECRHAESNLDFDDIRNFPATVFIDTAYEFRIAVVYMTIGLMQVPEAIKEAPAKGTQCFIPSILTDKLSKSFKWKNSDADLAFMQRGLVHLYEQNAVRHAAALIAVGGGAVPAGNDTEAAGLAKADDSLPWEDPAEAEKLQAVTADQENTAPAEAEPVSAPAPADSDPPGRSPLSTRRLRTDTPRHRCRAADPRTGCDAGSCPPPSPLAGDGRPPWAGHIHVAVAHPVHSLRSSARVAPCGGLPSNLP